MRTRRWAIRAAVLGVIAVSVGAIASPALASGPTTTSISSSRNPSSAGEDVTFTARVTAAFLFPTGVVQFFDGTSFLGPPKPVILDFGGFCDCIPTDHATASITRPLSAGTHIISVAFVSVTGDGPSGDSLVQVVNSATSTTVVSSSQNPSVYGQSVTLSAAVTSSGSTPSGSVQFRADGSDLGSPQTVDGSGHASLSTSTLSAGNHPVSAVFSSTNPNMLGSSGSLAGGQTVNPANTRTAVSSSPNPSEFGQSVTFTATETVDSPGAGTPTGSVQFQDNGANLGPAQTVDGSGRASITSNSPNFNGSSGSVGQTVNKARTTLTYDGATTSDFNDPAVLYAKLTRRDTTAPIAGATVSFTMASESCSGTTDANGEASCTITPSEAAAAFTVTATFAGNGNYLSSSDTKPFTVTKEETTTAYTGPTVIAQGNPVTLSGRLLEDAAAPIAGRVLSLTIGSGSGSQTCTTAPTDGSGNASCRIARVTIGQGPQPLRAEFAGDVYYLPSFDASKTAIIFAFPARGAFVLGDRTVAAAGPATNVTFWGAQWSTLNALTGGSASPSFKGFADTPSSKPPACGGTWTSEPGNSSSPVSTLPAYMGTIVSSSVGKSGSAISGNITKIVVVVTGPGYAADPGHPGTGTIVATYC